MTDPSARLACYDKILHVNNVPAEIKASPANTATQSTISATPVTSPSTKPSQPLAEDNFGMALKRATESANEDSRNFAVASASHTDFTGWKIEFTNGQVWKQIGTEQFQITVGETYSISSASFNSFLLGSASTRRKIRVTRER